MSALSFSPFAYPLLPGGGLFLLILGIFLGLGGWLVRLQKALLVAGFVFAGVAMTLYAARLSAPYGVPTKWQVGSLVVAILLEIVVISVMRRRLRDRSERSLTLAILTVVAAHFFIMLPAFGPVIGILGTACLINVTRAYRSARYSLRAAWIADGLLKALGGAGMLMLALAA